jgi:hypothetical protein
MSRDCPDTSVATVLWGGAPVVMPQGLDTSLNLVKKIMPWCHSCLHIFFYVVVMLLRSSVHRSV